MSAVTYHSCSDFIFKLLMSLKLEKDSCIFCAIRSLSAIRYRIHLNLCIALAVAQVVFLSGIEASSSRVN